jgi:hypothetical protein
MRHAANARVGKFYSLRASRPHWVSNSQCFRAAANIGPKYACFEPSGAGTTTRRDTALSEQWETDMSAAGRLWAVLVLALLVQPVWAAPVAVAAEDWVGSRSSAPGGGITAVSEWGDGGFNISWLITKTDGFFTYEYIISGPHGGPLALPLEEWILELNADADWTGVFPEDSAVVGWHDVTGSDGTPLGEGGPLFGVQFSSVGPVSSVGPGVFSFTIPFATTGEPTWGSYWAIDGRVDNGDGGLVVAYNEHFGQDPGGFENFTGFIPRPGPSAFRVPEPSTLALLLAALGIGAVVRRRRAHYG